MSQLRQVDNGDNSARMHEVVNQTIGQIREWYSDQRSELEVL
jgi:phytoene/squalene synthetase